MNVPKRHHVVPEFYLRRFARKGKVDVIDRENLDSHFSASVENALVHKHFYSLDTESGRDPRVELFFANHVEGHGKRAIERIVDKRLAASLPRLRKDLSTFLAFQLVRGEAYRRLQAEVFAAGTKQLMRKTRPDQLRTVLREARGIELTNAQVSRLVAFARNGRYDVCPDSEANLHLPGALKLALDLIPFFIEREWQLLEFDEPVLVTGDEPVGLVGPSTTPGAEPLGVMNANEVVFPTDPRHALVMVRRDRVATEERVRGTKLAAQTINEHVAFGCHRFVIRQPGTDPLNGLTLPIKAGAVRVEGDCVILQPRMSVDAAVRLRPPKKPPPRRRRKR